MLVFRQLQHLLPRGAAWRLTINKTLRRFFLGLAEEPAAARTYLDEIYEDLHPETTRQLAEWEKQFGLTPAADALEATRRLALAAEWQAQGGQSPGYIEGVLQTAGFDLYVHEWWDPDTEATRDPRDYTNQALVGIYQCTGDDEFGYPWPSQPQCSDFPSQPQCNGFLANETHYLVNKDLTRRAPPRVPDDEDTWPYFLYIGAEEFPDVALVDELRREEFERLILKIRPTQNWIVLRVAYVGEGEEPIMTEDDLNITTEDDQPLLT